MHANNMSGEYKFNLFSISVFMYYIEAPNSEVLVLLSMAMKVLISLFLVNGAGSIANAG